MCRRATIVVLLMICILGCATSREPLPRSRDAVDNGPLTDVASLPPFKALRIIGDGRVYLAADPEFELYVDGQRWADEAEMSVGDKLHVAMRNLIGTGSQWYDLLAVEDNAVVVRQNSWFYDIGPTWHRILRVRPYGDTR